MEISGNKVEFSIKNNCIEVDGHTYKAVVTTNPVMRTLLWTKDTHLEPTIHSATWDPTGITFNAEATYMQSPAAWSNNPPSPATKNMTMTVSPADVERLLTSGKAGASFNFVTSDGYEVGFEKQ